MNNLKQISILLIALVFVIGGVIIAGSISPLTNVPETNFVTLGDIYSKIEDDSYNATGHDLGPTDAISPSGNTLLEIWNKLDEAQTGISADKIIAGYNILGVAGTYDISNLTSDNVVAGTNYGTSSVGTME